MTSRDGGEPRQTIIEQAEQNPAAAREIAAARFGLNVVWALNEAVRSRGWPAKQLAGVLGVGESAVSQVLNGDGNVRVATIARYARALGFQARLVLEPVEPGIPSVVSPTGRKRRPPKRTPHEVVLPDSGWRVIKTAGGEVWTEETRLTAPAPDRLVFQTSYTRIDPVRTTGETASGTALTTGGLA